MGPKTRICILYLARQLYDLRRNTIFATKKIDIANFSILLFPGLYYIIGEEMPRNENII